MAVVSVTTFTVKSDRFDDFLTETRTSKPIMERSGARNIRLLAALVGGATTGSVALSWEVDDFAAHGAVLDKMFADPEMLALVSSVNTSAGTTAGFQVTTWVDVPL